MTYKPKGALPFELIKSNKPPMEQELKAFSVICNSYMTTQIPKLKSYSTWSEN